MRAPAQPYLAKTLFVYALLLLGVYLAYGQTAHFAYVEFDDPDYVYQNPFVIHGLTPRGVLWAFTHFRSSNWHPLTWISHMTDRQFGLGPGGQHVVNFVLHGISACLLFTLLLRLNARSTGFSRNADPIPAEAGTTSAAFWPSTMVAAVFAFHPLRVESVAWIAERKDVLGGLFFFLTLLAYESYIRNGQTPGRYLLATLFFILGLMSKPMLVTLPLVALLLDYWPLGRLRAAFLPRVVEKLPWLLLSAGSCVITFVAQGRAISTLDRLPLSLRLPNALISYVAYLGQMFWPVNLAVFYPHPWKSPPAWATAGAVLVLVAISFAAVGLRRRHPYLLVGWLWYLGMLVPVIGLVQVGRQAMADRYTYLPQIGLYVALVWAAANWIRASRMRAAASLLAAAILAALLVAAWRQTSYWRDNLALWTRAVSCTPENALALNNLASALLNVGDADGARADIERAIAVQPDFALAYYNRGRLLAREGRLLEHEGHARQAVEKRKAAIAAIEHAVQLEPSSPVTQNELAMLLVADRRPREAILYLNHVLELDPDALVVMENLAWVLATTPPAEGGDGPRAVALAERVCRTLPSPGVDEYDVLAAAYAAAGRYADAAAAAQRALQLAAAAGQSDLAAKIRERMELYTEKKPYRE